MLRKWYFCLSESSMDRSHHGWRDLVIHAVNSALRNTDLEPILLFDGDENNPFLNTLRARGVKIVKHRVSFFEALRRRDEQQPGYLAISSGAFLRVDIPLIEEEDEFVLYTDCDVVFLRHPQGLDIRPTYFACAPQTSRNDYENDANSGVLIINVPKMRESYSDFAGFIQDNLFQGWPGCDQENYRRFYRGKWDKLPLSMNWKPYWGGNQDIDIVHWHGPKPEAILSKIENPKLALPPAWESLYAHNKEAYAAFVDQWVTFADSPAAYLAARTASKETKVNSGGVEVRTAGFIDAASLNHIDRVLTMRGWYVVEGKRASSFSVSLDGAPLPIISIEHYERPDVIRKVSGVFDAECGFLIKAKLPETETLNGGESIELSDPSTGFCIKRQIA